MIPFENTSETDFKTWNKVVFKHNCNMRNIWLTYSYFGSIPLYYQVMQSVYPEGKQSHPVPIDMLHDRASII